MNDIIYLQIVQPVNEADALRMGNRNHNTGAVDTGPGGRINAPDWRLWNASGFGRRLQSSLRGGEGYAYEVTDMGQYVAVRASFHNMATGKGVSKTFVVAFDRPDGADGKVFATSTKWRTISSCEQAASYIKSTIQSMA